MADGKGVNAMDMIPQDAELERATLGAVILTERWPAALRTDMFFNPRNQTTAVFLEGMARDGRALDLVTILSVLTEAQRGAECPSDLRLIQFRDLAALPNSCPSPENLPGWIERLREIRHRRALWRWTQEIRSAVASGDWEAVERLQRAAPKASEVGQEPTGAPGGGLPAAGAREREVMAALRRLRSRDSSARTMAAEVLRTDSRWSGLIWYDDFRKLKMLGARAWTDHDDQRVAEWLARVYQVEISADSLRPICAAIGDDHRRDPLQEYLRGLVWDGVERIDGWLVWGMGAADTPINRWMGAAWLIQAVARALRPGCQADATLVLLGEQGEGKTSTLRELVGAFWSESKIDIGNVPRCYQQVAAAWVHELGEMSQFLGSRLDQNEAKNFLTSPVDRFIPLHGRAPVHWARRCVFIGTTNRPEFLRDPTGARRFWPVELGVSGPVQREQVVSLRDQLWAEAVHRFNAGAEWWLPRARWGELRSVQADYQQADAWAEAVEQWISEYAHVQATPGGLPVLTVRETGHPATTKTLLVSAVGKDLDRIAPQDCSRMGDILTGLGYRARKVRQGDRLVNGYIQKEADG